VGFVVVCVLGFVFCLVVVSGSVWVGFWVFYMSIIGDLTVT
jgi:hypothetical protein